jgi:hypothetical protein
MAIINYDGISGINSITSVSGAVKFYDTTGAASFAITPTGTGNASFGQALSISDLSWGKDPYQQVYSFSGTTGGSTSSPADGSLLLGNPNANPSATRVGTIVFGNKVSGTSVTGNPGIKAVIDSITNTNVANAADTGGSLRFYTKPDNGELAVRMTIDSGGRMTAPYQPSFRVSRSNTTALSAGVVLFDNIFHNIGSCYSAATGRFTAPVAGVYFVSATGGKDSNSNVGWGFDIRKNGTTVARVELASATFGYTWKSGCAVVQMAANDYFDVNIFTATVQFEPGLGNFCGYLIG